MVLFNYSTRELTAKIVYYGPGLCGKTTNLQYIHANLPDNIRGKMLSLATKTDRTLFFDFLPVDLGEIRGMRTRVQLYTVPGQVFYNETRKLVLKGADGIVFVADSQEQMLGPNVESFRNLEENLKGHGLKLAEMPHILQFNKRDLPKITSIEDLNSQLNRYNAPFYESVATSGIGVQDTLKAIFKLVLLQLTRKYDPKAAAGAPAPARPRVEIEAPRAAPQVRSIPVAPAPAPQARPAIPLSSVEPPATRRAAASARPAPSVPVEEPEDMPAFAAQEIDDLVHEVEDSYPAAAPAETPIRLQAQPAAPAPPSIAPRRAVPPPPPLRTRDVGQFEVDRGFDPEWTPEPSSVRPEELLGDLDAPGGSIDLPPAAPPSVRIAAVPIEDEEVEIPIHQEIPEEPVRASGEPAVFLTEVAEDRHLFEDPSLDIARFAAGDHREIVVPVEFTEGGTVRRFKLTIRLRFDPLD